MADDRSARVRVPGERARRLLARLATRGATYDPMTSPVTGPRLTREDVAWAVAMVRDPLMQRIALYLWGGHDGLRDAAVICQWAAKRWKTHPDLARKECLTVERLVGLALQEITGYSPRHGVSMTTHCQQCSATGRVYSRLHAVEGAAEGADGGGFPCGKCGGVGRFPWSHYRRAKVYGTGSSNWRRKFAAAYAVVLAKLQALEARAGRKIVNALESEGGE